MGMKPVSSSVSLCSRLGGPVAKYCFVLPAISVLLNLVSLSAPVLADDKKPQELKSTQDPLPKGMRKFNGMLLGRLAAKDVEKGTFVVQVDAVPRVWRNSQAEDPQSVVNKTVEVSGVFGKFLDVLVVTRKGDTLEFECKHDGDGLTFPGEMLRKVAPYDPEDFPELPEAFRGFQGSLVADIKKKDAETMEMIVEVQNIKQTWDGNRAKEPKSIEGKPMMLAGFWTRKEAYHKLKVGDRIEAGMKHISLRSNHMSLERFVRKVEFEASSGTMMKESEGQAEEGLTKELRGFRGMLVGKLTAKDVERGTFSVKVDAVPRVWNNNQSRKPKSFIGKIAEAEGVHSRLLDTLVVSRVGDTIKFGALHDGGDRLRVVELLQKVAPVEPGDYPELPDGFRGFRGILAGKVIKKDDVLLELVVEVSKVDKSFDRSKAKDLESIVGKQVMLAGFWRRKEAFHKIKVGDTVRTGVEHPQALSDHLSVIEKFEKVEP